MPHWCSTSSSLLPGSLQLFKEEQMPEEVASEKYIRNCNAARLAVKQATYLLISKCSPLTSQWFFCLAQRSLQSLSLPIPCVFSLPFTSLSPLRLFFLIIGLSVREEEGLTGPIQCPSFASGEDQAPTAPGQLSAQEVQTVTKERVKMLQKAPEK